MLEAKNITKTFHSEGLDTYALAGADLSVEPGEFVSIVGRSGSGKTTFSISCQRSCSRILVRFYTKART